MKKILITTIFLVTLIILASQARASWFGDLFTGSYHELETVTGDETDNIKISKDSAEVVLEKWGGEASLTIKRRGDFGPSVKDLTSNIYSTNEKGGKESFLAEPVKGGIKIDIMLYAKPDTNVFSFDVIGWEDFNFFYQPALTEKQLSPDQAAKLDRCTETDCYDTEGKVFLHRPEEIVGSYAIYHKTKKDNQYKTGKAFHIERPLIVDAEGKEVWAELDFTDGVLSVITPQEFLDKAVYPVRIDPNFGVTSQGASQVGIGDNTFFAIAATAPGSGTVTSVSAWFNAGSSGRNVKGLLTSDSWVLQSGGVGASTAIPLGAGLVTSGSMTAAITGSTVYGIGIVINSTNINMYYDDGTGYDGAIDFTTPGNPTSVDSIGEMWSIYATYSQPAQGGTNTVVRFIRGTIKFFGGKIVIK